MELNTTLLIDTALNVVGYLTAAALSLVVYSMFRRNRGRIATESAAAPENRDAGISSGADKTRPVDRPGPRSMQYVGFSGDTPAESRETPGSLTLRRNRAEVLKMARSMIRQGATDEQIKESLPVSDAELAVLNYERK